jgi:hypothetical protein
MSHALMHRSFAELLASQEEPRRHNLFQMRPTQVAAKEVVTFSPPQNRDAALAEADRKLAAGESLLPKPVGSATVIRCA